MIFKLKRLALFGIWMLLLSSCLERFDLKLSELDAALKDVYVEGLITDEPGPYIIKLSRPLSVTDILSNYGKPISAKKVTLSDNAGNTEVLDEIERGTYSTKAGGIRGVVGRSYQLKIEMNDGRIFESSSELIKEVSPVDSIYYELDRVQPVDAPTRYGLRIFMDSKKASSDDLLRWRFSGVYIVNTQPEKHYSSGCGPPCGCFDPEGCSSYFGGICTCCRCWVTQVENGPMVNSRIEVNGGYKKVEVGYVPINYYTFYEKYRVEVKQMSLSQEAFNYWKTIQDQIEGVQSIFQPAIGKAKSNLREVNGLGGVQGLFYASSVKKKQLYIDKSDIHVEIYVPVNCDGETGPAYKKCTEAFARSLNYPPADWKN